VYTSPETKSTGFSVVSVRKWTIFPSGHSGQFAASSLDFRLQLSAVAKSLFLEKGDLFDI